VGWIGLGLAYALLLRDIDEHGVLALYTVVLAVWAGDSAAFLIGLLLGRHKLAPTVSPGKTWEGLIAGTVATIAVTFIALYESNFLSIPESLVLGAVIAIAAPLGDLFESALKRDADVKDSGRLLAGHGGVLDRIDALLFAWVAAYYMVAAFGQL
jgi:phosphatidate cytidylyltransferase